MKKLLINLENSLWHGSGWYEFCFRSKTTNLGDAPNQPSNSAFPMRQFGQKKTVKRAFNPKWFSSWHWLHYDSSQDRSFCYTCVKAVNAGNLSLASGNIKDSPFVCGRFSNWKAATVAFACHEQTSTHQTAAAVLVTIPETRMDIGEMFSSAHAEGKNISRQCLVAIAELLPDKALRYEEMKTQRIAILSNFSTSLLFSSLN